MANATMIKIEAALLRSTTAPLEGAARLGEARPALMPVRRPSHSRPRSARSAGREFPPLPATDIQPQRPAALFLIHAIRRQCVASSALGVAD